MKQLCGPKVGCGCCGGGSAGRVQHRNLLLGFAASYSIKAASLDTTMYLLKLAPTDNRTPTFAPAGGWRQLRVATCRSTGRGYLLRVSEQTAAVRHHGDSRVEPLNFDKLRARVGEGNSPLPHWDLEYVVLGLSLFELFVGTRLLVSRLKSSL